MHFLRKSSKSLFSRTTCLTNWRTVDTTCQAKVSKLVKAACFYNVPSPRSQKLQAHGQVHTQNTAINIIDVGVWCTCHIPSVCVETMDCAELWCCSTGCSSFRQWLKRETMQRIEEEERAKQTEHRESAIDDMHILVNSLASVNSMLHRVFAPGGKQRTGFTLPLRSCHYRHTLHIIASREFTPTGQQSSSVQIDTTLWSGLTETGSKSIRFEPG